MSQKKYLLPKVGNFYKANLHSHSTFSDGSLTPEEMKRAYMERGYSIIAYTDHNIFVSHNDLSDENFLAINGMEIDFYECWNHDYTPTGKDWRSCKGCHLNFLALNPDIIYQPCFNKNTNRIIGEGKKYAHLIQYDESKPPYEKVYTYKGVTKTIKEAVDCGFYVIYNHPAWSLEDYNDYINFQGFHAMEICNFGSFNGGYDDYNPKIYDDLLRSGRKVFCVGADDNHNHHPFSSRQNDSFGAFTMIKADNLEYTTIASALLKGDFYASQGPEIFELYYEDGKIYIKCSKADRIVINTGRRRVECVYDEIGDGVTEATFNIYPDDVYIRITVDDKFGKRANTNAYFIEDIIK